MLNCFRCVQLSPTLWTVDFQVLCPGDSLGKNTGMGCHFLFQGLNPCLLFLLCWKADSVPHATYKVYMLIPNS